ncbi:hypothetical protein CLF_103257 [Clonorchis sinensis]|uniref:Integrase catalytic domain-containing protein n=1 Tax=Clonorchis sinensis TaxID=79923 RepID=G7Y9E9_CLOSI|nr:hypothetical protein CLF_103257 [Clonorchis sinensis]
MRKVFSHEGVPTALVTDNGTRFTAKSLGEWPKGLGCRHLFTATRHPQSNGLAENFVRTLKSAITSFSPTSFVELDLGIDNLLMHYRNAVHFVTGKSPAFLFKSRSLRTSLDCTKTADVTFFKGNDLRPATGIILSSNGKRMVTILDLDDLSCHRRHIDQVEFNIRSQSVNGTSGVSNSNESFVEISMYPNKKLSLKNIPLAKNLKFPIRENPKDYDQDNHMLIQGVAGVMKMIDALFIVHIHNLRQGQVCSVVQGTYRRMRDGLILLRHQGQQYASSGNWCLTARIINDINNNSK